RGPGEVLRVGGHGRRVGRELPAGCDGGTGSRLRVLVGAVPPAHLPVDTGISVRQPTRRAPGVGRAGPGPLGTAMGTARVASRADLPGQPDAKRRRAVPGADGHLGRLARTGADRSRPKSGDLPLPTRARPYDHA